MTARLSACSISRRRVAAPSRAVLRSSRGEDPVSPGFGHLVQRPEQIGGHIESPVVGHLKWPRQIDQGARSLNVNIGIRIQDAEHDTLGAQLFSHEHVARITSNSSAL